MPDWMPDAGNASLLLPLRHRGGLFGVMVLALRRTRDPLDPEERALLAVVARQAASHLAEDAATHKLAEIEQFESFNRRFAFVMHDVKNVAAQLAMGLSNARRHRGNDAFYEDLLDTLDASSARLRSLIERIRDGGRPVRSVVRLDELLREIASDRVAAGVMRTDIRADPERLRAVLSNIVANAEDAAGNGEAAGEGVELFLRAEDGMAVVEVRDHGPGMDPMFVEQSLFTPFSTTKEEGFGLGMADARDTIEAMGGRIEVESRLGEGSVVRILLPLAEPAGVL